MKNYLRFLGKVIGPQYEAFFVIFLLFVLLSITEAIGVGIIIPVFSSLNNQVVNVGTNENLLISFLYEFGSFFGLEGTSGLLILMALIFYLKAIIGYSTLRFIFKFGYSNQKRLIDSLVMKYQEMAVSEYSKMQSSELIQNLIINVETITMGSIVASIRLISEIFVALSIAIIIFIVEPLATIILISVFIFVIAIYSTIFKKRIRKAGEDSAESRVVVIKNFQTLMQGFKEVHVIGRLSYFNNMIFDGTKKVKSSGVEYKSLSVLIRYVVESTAVSIFVIIFFVAEYTGESQVEIVSTLAMFGVAAVRLIPGLNQVTASIVQMNNSSYALKKVFEGLTFEINQSKKDSSLVKYDEQDAQADEFKKIVFDNVQFTHYGNKVPTLSSVNLSVNKGELICFHGESGSGKTTAFDLMLNFYSLDKGKVLGNDMDVSQLNNWIKSFVYVAQDPYLFGGTVHENITVGLEEKGRKIKVNEAIRLACLSDFIDSLPGGIYTQLGERGVNISGGQRQRIALARAFFLDRFVLLLDEPTSALDKNTTLLLMENLLEMRNEKTIIITSHDKDVVNMCDRAYFFNAGKVISM